MYKQLICLLMMLVLTGCGFFQLRRPIVEQGNIITNESVSQLHTGMTSDQVTAVMGTPVVANILTPNRMEYVYTYQDGSSPRIVKRVTLLFSQGRLKEIQRN